MAGLSGLDFAILIVCLLATVAVGSRFAKRQRSLEKYFVAARATAWWVEADRHHGA